MQTNHITYPQETVCTRPRVEQLQAGDEVEVFDGRLGDYVWLMVMDVVERDGRTKLRVEGYAFYFDESLTRDIRINHYVWPHHAPQPVPIDLQRHGDWSVALYGWSGYVDHTAKRTINS
jgi:hypothetical protein